MSEGGRNGSDVGLSSIVSIFKELVWTKNMAVPVAAMNALVMKIKDSEAGTWMQLEQELRQTIKELKNCSDDVLMGRSRISMGSGCELFMKYVTRAFNLEFRDFSSCKVELLRRGEKFAGMSLSSRVRIAQIGHSFIQENCTVLLHGVSRVVNAVVLKAAETRYFNLIITEARPGSAGVESIKEFEASGIPIRLVPDSAIGTVMEQVDLCLVGAEGVMENGGIINKVGTYQIALVAKALQRPFYVAVESYKFARMYPLSQRDLSFNSSSNGEVAANVCCSGKVEKDIISQSSGDKEEHRKQVLQQHFGSDLPWPLPANVSVHIPTTDFTPANLITLLFTDLGVLTPAAVSDELIRLYQ